MKDPFDRTKVVLRHLPPAISHSALMDQIDGRFSGRYKWVCFRPGKSSQKNQRFSRAYIDFKRAEDVVEFAEFFDGHIFVNEKGSQFKALVEYAPSQHVPKVWSKKDGREGTILKDPEYLEFLELLAKPVDNLPSAEIQLERREAERAGGAKEALVVTPLMDFVRQKRATRSGSQRLSVNGKLSRRSGRVLPSSSSPSSRRGSEKRRVATPVYVLRDSTKNGSGKDRSAYILMSRREELQLSDSSVAVASASGTEVSEHETGNVSGSNGTISGASGAVETGKRGLLLLKGKEREGSHQQSTTSSVRNSSGSTAFKQNQRHEASGRIIRSILSNKEARQSLSYANSSQSDQQIPSVLEKDKRPPRPPSTRPILKDQISSISPLAPVCDSDGKRSLDDKVAVRDLHGSVSIIDKYDKRTRNRDRPDRGVWAPLRRSDGSHASDEDISSSSLPAQMLSDSLEGISISQHVAGVKVGDDDTGIHNADIGRGSNSLPDIWLSRGETRADMPNASRSAEIRSLGSGRVSLTPAENGSHRHVGRRGPVHGLKEADGSLNIPEGKPSKRGGPTGYGSHERQVWVQKPGSGS